MKFYASHGMEIEFFVIGPEGKIVKKPGLNKIWEHMFNGASEEILNSRKNAPSFVKSKIHDIWVDEVEIYGEFMKYVSVVYSTREGKTRINIFGPDPNVSQSTLLLEIATPPATSLEELEYWITLLTNAAKTNLPEGYSILSVGFHPMEESYEGGLTCGEHHHLSFPTKTERIMMYNLMRIFVPHFIAISADSPVRGGKVKGHVKLITLQDGRKLLKEYGLLASTRLGYNTGQLGPNNERYLPYANPAMSAAEFAAYINRLGPDARYVDIYPYTKYGTLEIRFMDSQVDPSIRKGIVVLLEALALKAHKMIKEDIELPVIKSDIIYANRMRAIRDALHGEYEAHGDNLGWLEEFYCRDFRGRKITTLLHATRRMVDMLKPELEELGVTHELDSILMMLYGNNTWAPPLDQATYLAHKAIFLHSPVEYIKLLYSGKIDIFHMPVSDLREFLSPVVVEYNQEVEMEDTGNKYILELPAVKPEIRFADIEFPRFHRDGPSISIGKKEWSDDKYKISLWLPKEISQQSVGIVHIKGNLFDSKITVGSYLPPEAIYLTYHANSPSLALPVPIPSSNEKGKKKINIGIFVNDREIARFYREIKFTGKNSAVPFISSIMSGIGKTTMNISGSGDVRVLILGPTELELWSGEINTRKAIHTFIPYSFYPRYFAVVLDKNGNSAYCRLIIPPKPEFSAFVSADTPVDKVEGGRKYRIYLNVDSDEEFFIREILVKKSLVITGVNTVEKNEKIIKVNVGRNISKDSILLLKWKVPALKRNQRGEITFNARLFDNHGPIWLPIKPLKLTIIGKK